GFPRESCFRDELLLGVTDFLYRHFHAKVTPRHHDAISGAQDFFVTRECIRAFNFGDDKWLAANFCCGRADCFNIGCTLHERLADRVYTGVERELETLAIAFGEGTDAQIDAGEIQSLMRAQLATHRNDAFDIVPGHAFDPELDQAVIEKEPVPRFHHTR